MKSYDIIKHFPNASASTIARNQAAVEGPGEPTKLQEQETCDPAQRGDVSNADNASQGQEMDGGSRPRYRISVVFLVSDNRRRDNPGMLETICDVVVAAGRRLAGLGDRFRNNKTGAKRRGRRGN